MGETLFEELLGKTLIKLVGCAVGSAGIRFHTDCAEYRLAHHQDCCESVEVAEIVGDPSDLIGQPLIEAEQVSNADGPAPEYPDSYTWTFYKLGTRKGHVVLRWLGESNGYYSEEAYFEKVA